MTARTYSRGHPTEYVDGRWIYSDSGEPDHGDRPCVRCGERPTAEGYDACLGRVDGAASACCGHGVESGYQVRREPLPLD